MNPKIVAKLRAELDGFGSTENYTWLLKPIVAISDGVQHLIEYPDTKGFFDIIASYQIKLYLKEQCYHQHWTIERTDRCYEIWMEDLYGSRGKVKMQTVSLNEFNFPFNTFTVHLGYLGDRRCGICLLNEEN
jgi:hypothetical protein